MVFQNKYNSEGLLNTDYQKKCNNQARSGYYATSQEPRGTEEGERL